MPGPYDRPLAIRRLSASGRTAKATKQPKDTKGNHPVFTPFVIQTPLPVLTADHLCIRAVLLSALRGETGQEPSKG